MTTRAPARGEWVARVEWYSYRDDTVLEDELDEVTDKLADHDAAVAIDERDERPGYPSLLSATITILGANTLRPAIAAALQLVEDAIGEKALGVEVLRHHEYIRRQDAPAIPDLVTNSDIAKILGVSRQRVTQLNHRPDFPPAATHTGQGPLRLRSQVEAFAASWERNNKGGRPRLEEEARR
jgi:hypothetical protein